MAFGATNEYMIFPIIDIVRREVKNMIRNGTISLDQLADNTLGSNGLTINTDNSITKVVVDGNLLSKLESNDFKLTLEKNDESNPRLLTGVTIEFGEELKEVVSLLRQNGKLAYVKIAIVLREKSIDKISNPFRMSGNDFVEYVRNKRLWQYYTGIIKDSGASQSDKDSAEAKIEYLSVRNTELRSQYSIADSADMSLDDLLKYMKNPLGMDTYDFIEYCRNGRKWIKGTEIEKNEAHADNVALRAKYGIAEEDAAAFTDLDRYLPNPLGMHQDDFLTYVHNLEKWDTLDPTVPEDMGEITRIQNDNEQLLFKYYTEDTYSLNILEGYLGDNTTVYDEKVLLRILMSLIYDKNGKLANVKSETQEGD